MARQKQKTTNKKEAKESPKDKKKNNILTIIVAIIVFAVFWAIYQSGRSNNDQQSTAPAQKQSWKRLAEDETECDALVCVKVSNTEFDSTYGYGHIYGAAVNYTGKDLKYIQLSFGLYDGETKTGSCFTNQSYLENGKTWAFEAYCTGSSAKQFKLEDVSYW